jgi:hypothetical protein
VVVDSDLNSGSTLGMEEASGKTRENGAKDSTAAKVPRIKSSLTYFG